MGCKKSCLACMVAFLLLFRGFGWHDHAHWCRAADLYQLPTDPPTPRAGHAAIVRTSTLNVHYGVYGLRPEDLLRIELWYAQDDHGPWQLYGYDDDRASPVLFAPPAEGFYRLLVVAVDRWGRCSSQAGSSTDSVQLPGQVSVFVDYTKPQLYLYSPLPGPSDNPSRRLRIRWSGFDRHLAVSPVRLFYQRQGTQEWLAIADSAPSSGAIDWTPPDQLDGPVMLRAVLADRAGNSVTQLSGWLDLNPNNDTAEGPADLPDRVAPAVAPAASATAAQEPPPEVPLTAEDTRQAGRYFQKGLVHSQRREWSEAIEAYKLALDYDPACVEAQINLGNCCCRLGEYETARMTFEAALERKPDSNTALYGLAQSQLALQQYAQAQVVLDRLLQRDRRDWQVWILRGDTAEKLGQKNVALDSWRTAALGAKEVLPEVAHSAQQRISRYLP